MHPVQLFIKTRFPQYLLFALIIIPFSTQLRDSKEDISTDVKSTCSPISFQKMPVIIDDFLVNDDTISISVQQLPSIAQDPSGDFVVAWEDYRNGESDIYAQRYNSTGSPIGLNFKVNDDFRTGQNYPAIAMDFTGNFIITWEDTRNGESDIYAQRYNSSGTPLGPNFRVNDDAGDAVQRHPDIAMDSAGDFIITWEDHRADYPGDIYAQRYSCSGALLGPNFKVNDDAGSAGQYGAVVGMDKIGNFVITWEDYRVDFYGDIYAERYSSSGSPIGSNFRVNDDSGSQYQWHPAMTMNGPGNFIITWQDGRDGAFNIYAQRYNSSGSMLGSNFKANDDLWPIYHFTPTLAMDCSGNFIISWRDDRNGIPDIYAQRYNSSGIPLNSNFRVNDDTGTSDQGDPAITMDCSGDFVIAWEDYRNINLDVYAQRYNASGSMLGPNFEVNDDVSTADQFLSAIAMDNSGSFVITWEDYRFDDYGDIYAQRYNSSGVPTGSNFKVNNDTGNAYQWYPAVAMDGSGNFVVAWQDERIGKWDIYAQRYNSSGAPLGSNFKVNDNVRANHQYYAAIAMNSSGDFIITWTCERSEGYGVYSDIYAQRYRSSGNPVGTNFKVNDDTGTVDQWWPAIVIDADGNFVITWQGEDYRYNYNWDIYAQRYDSLGSPLGSNFRVNDDVGIADQYNPAIAMDSSGNYVITWEDYRNSIPDIYAQRYNAFGTLIGSNFKVNDDIGTGYQWYPAVAVDRSGNFVITWDDYRNRNYDIYAQRFNSSGAPLGSNYLVPNPLYASFAQGTSAVVANNSNIIITWTDDRRAKGWDVYAKVVDWNWTKVEDEQNAGLPKSFELSQNYPNPFNPITTIPFQAGSSEQVAGSPIHTTLKIYNILGQKVRTLVDEEKAPGNYNIIWDGKDDSGKEVASGIYFYQLKTKDYTATKKMVLLR
jgi:hypothetical protein